MKLFLVSEKNISIYAFLFLQIAYLTAAQEVRDDNTMFRLPDALIPENYDLFFHIEPEKDDFSGTVNITLLLADENSTVQYIYLHADAEYVTITSAKLNDVNNCTTDKLNNQILKMSCGNITEIDNFLYIEYNGKYSETDGYGLVKAHYMQKTKQSIIESYFEPTFARRAFPCFDEPDFKATFSIKITYPETYTAIINAISNNTVNEDNYKTTTFQPTPRISTYLVAVFVSNFKETTSAIGDEEYIFKILTKSDAENLTSKVAGVYYSKIMSTLSNFTGQSFQDIGDPECYQVAIPDYYSEHMGNFGLFAYKERDLLDEGDKTSAKVAQNIIQTMTYKLSHQWFGGEISTMWWSDVWANEAVPTYFKYIIPNQFAEGYELTNQFVVDVVQKAMQYDAMPFVEPLSSNGSDLTNEWRIESKLDQYSLLKGATLLHMINYMLGGEDQFKANIQDHLQNRNGEDTDGDDMLKDLSKHDGIQDLYSASYPWAFIAGFPLLIVKINATTEEEETLQVSQKRFVYPIDNSSVFDDDVKWTIPISYTTSTNKYFDTVINVYYAPNIELSIKIYKDDWVLFNIQGRLHYRVNYQEELWRRIISALKNDTERTEIHPLSRAQVIDDIFNIARTGDVEYSIVFELADTLVNETEYYPWCAALNGFSYLLGKMKDDDTEENLKAYILSLMDNVINISDPGLNTQENETHIDILRRVMVLDWACKLGHSDCINFAAEKFTDYLKNQTSIEDYNLRRVILCNGIRYSQNVSEDWRSLWSIYLSSSSVHEQDDILHALGCAEDKKKLLDYLLKLATPILTTDIKRQDTLLVFESVLSSSEGIEAAMSFLGSSLAYIQFIFTGGDDEIYVLSDMILALSEKLTTDGQLDWLQNILNDKALGSYSDLKTKAKTLATVNNYWAKQYQDVIRDILLQPSSSTVTESTTTTQSSSTSTTESTVTTSTSSTSKPTSTEPSTTTKHSSQSSEIIFVSQTILSICIILLAIF